MSKVIFDCFIAQIYINYFKKKIFLLIFLLYIYITIQYEWFYETVEDGNIIDNDFEDKLSNYTQNRISNTLCLVRNEGDDINGLQDRYWACVKDGKLPDFFTDGCNEQVNIRVPIKFHKELKLYNTK